MDTELNIVISQYEEEMGRLRKLIEEAQDDAEYLSAHYHTIALQQTEQTLRILKRFDDVLWWRKEMLQNRMASIKKIAAKGMAKIFRDEMRELKREFLALNEIPKKQVATPSVNIINFTLVRLMRKEFKEFRIVLEREQDFYLRFRYPRKTLLVTLPLVKKHLGTGFIDISTVNDLQKLGFLPVGNQSQLRLMIEGEPEDQLEKLQTVLIHFFFNQFYHLIPDQLAFIEITEPHET